MEEETMAEATVFLLMFAHMKKVLRESGWTQRRLCQALGRSEPWLSKIFHSGRGMDVNDLIKIAEVTGISPETLLAGFPLKIPVITESDRIAEKLREILPADVLAKLVEQEKTKDK